jgi:ribosomal protein S18 acetylase RimI-like enzyme
MVRRRIPPPLERVGQPRLREGTISDMAFIRSLSETVFDQFGDYGEFLPTYLEHDSVFTIIAERADGASVGFLMLALVTSSRTMPWEEEEHESEQEQSLFEEELPHALDAEILAIAVQPEHQSRGCGRRLIEYAVTCARGWHSTLGVRSLQLNVAHTNQQAKGFFEHMGFREVDPFDGVYPRGQRSIRMAVQLRSA